MHARIVDNRIYIPRTFKSNVDGIFNMFCNDGPVLNMDNVYWVFPYSRINVMKSYLLGRGFELE